MKSDCIALCPDIPEDKDVVYSGSGIVANGKLHLFYTGNVKYDGDFDLINEGRGANVIYVTTEDGIHVSKKQVVLRNEDYPDFCSCHVRDPKIWKENDTWKMVLGARTKDSRGCVLFYESKDLEQWDYIGVNEIPDFGFMWECPDYFTIDGHKYLSLSPQGLESQETKFQNVYQSGYFKVEGNVVDGKLSEFREWDMGFDFYAPQTFEDGDGRRIIIGWMGIGDIPYENPTTKLGWQHCLTVPREVTIGEDGRLLQNPIKEMTKLRKREKKFEQLSNETKKLSFELYSEVKGEFSLEFDRKLKLFWDQKACLFKLEFQDEEYGAKRDVRKAELLECKDIRILADRSSLEIYLNGGEVVFSTRFYPEGEEVELNSEGLEGITIWEL